MAWRKRKATFSVTLPILADAEGKPVKFQTEVDVPEGNHDDFSAWWKSKGWNPARTLTRILNYLEKQSKEGYKAPLRDLVTAKALEIIEAGETDPEKVLKKLHADAEVKAAVKEFQTACLDNHIGETKGSPSGIKKAAAADVGKALLEADPDRLRALAKDLGIEI
jgi:hypothetical protein